jgi:uncharacterized RDD family membrane protein YckC
MKCPKCGYLGFEPVERCRNCGYDFSLSQPVVLPELTIRSDSPDYDPLDDFALSEPPRRDTANRFEIDKELERDVEREVDLDRILGAPAPAPSTSAPSPWRSLEAPPASPSAPPGEPSLFGPPITDDVPLITKASAPRPPLAVRRATAEPPRLHADSHTPSLDLPLDLDFPNSEPWTPLSPRERASGFEPINLLEPPPEEAAGVLARVGAAAIDLLILAAVDVMVIYFTLQICGVGLDDFAVVPKGPLIAFLLVQNGGYLVAFTLGGQTLGKMAAGIRVVPDEPDAPLDFGRACLRTLVWLALALPAGLGFLSAIVSPDHRGLHDRFARTRVVRASAR